MPETNLTRTPAGADGVRVSWDLLILGPLLLYFAARLIWFALQIRPGVPPDEATHFETCQLYAQTFLLPADSAESYQLGLVSRQPYAYYFVMGRLLNLNASLFQELTFLRFCNAGLGLATVALGCALMWRLTTNRIARVLFAVMITNTLMFTFLCASVNYDNLANLAAAAACLSLFAYFQTRDGRWLAALFASALLGSLSKFTLLPLAGILLLLLLLRERNSVFAFVRGKTRLLPNRVSRQTLLAFAPAVVLLALNVELYGVNLVRFGRLVPRADQVLPLEHCMENWVFARDYILGRLREGRISYRQAVHLAEQLEDPVGRRDTRGMIEHWRYRVATGQRQMGRIEYAGRWASMVMDRIIGVLAHLSLPKRGWRRQTIVAVFALAAFSAAAGPTISRRLFGRAMTRIPGEWYALSIVVFYGVLLMGFNYSVYSRTGHLQLGVQGRYMFPVIVPACAWLAGGLICYWPRRLAAALAAATALVFIEGDLPYFIRYATSQWYQ